MNYWLDIAYLYDLIRGLTVCIHRLSEEAYHTPQNSPLDDRSPRSLPPVF